MLSQIVSFVLRVVPDATATSITCALASLIQRPAVSAIEQQAIDKATRMSYGANGSVAWVWGSGPLVVFVHGWGGRASQMAPLALHVSELGFRCVAIEVTGHGDSPKRRTRWAYFMRDIGDIAEALACEVYAYVGHSAGALSMMAARSLQGVRAQRYVCICAPSHPFPAINVIKKRLSPRSAVIDRYKALIASQFETQWERLERGDAFANAGRDLLLFYDESDRFVPDSEGDKLQTLCPGSRLVKTNKYGHQRILGAPELTHAVSEFLRSTTRSVSAAS
jgi:pimeloyl-ACP methyl ester carboxylesterase